MNPLSQLLAAVDLLGDPVEELRVVHADGSPQIDGVLTSEEERVLWKQLPHGDPRWSVEDEPEGALLGVLADQDRRVREVGVREVRGGCEDRPGRSAELAHAPLSIEGSAPS